MRKIFRYECRRLLWNKFFIGLAVVLLLYGALVLHAVTILGVSHTAPFSPWSFGDYLSRMLPLLSYIPPASATTSIPSIF